MYLKTILSLITSFTRFIKKNIYTITDGRAPQLIKILLLLVFYFFNLLFYPCLLEEEIPSESKEKKDFWIAALMFGCVVILSLYCTRNGGSIPPVNPEDLLTISSTNIPGGTTALEGVINTVTEEPSFTETFIQSAVNDLEGLENSANSSVSTTASIERKNLEDIELKKLIAFMKDTD